jgi:hypothetical protein
MQVVDGTNDGQRGNDDMVAVRTSATHFALQTTPWTRFGIIEVL